MGRQYTDPAKKVEMLKEATKPVTCATLADVKAALEPFLKRVENREVKMSVDLSWSDKDGSGTDKIIGTSRDTPLYTLLIEGMDVVKKRIEVTEKLKEAIKAAEENEEADDGPSNMVVWGVDEQRFRVDQLIQKKLGGKRHGVRVRWTVQEGTYEYDPYTQKLFEVT